MRAGIQTIRPLVLAVLASTVILIGNIFSPSAATAATYYAAPSGNDSNPGTSASPFKTVAKLASRLSAGDTGILKDGTYNEDYITIYNSQSGTATNRVTLKAQNKWGATIHMNEGSRCFSKIYNYASYWTFEDFYITQSDVCPNGFTSADVAIQCVDANSGGGTGCIVRGIKLDNMYQGLKILQHNAIVEGVTTYASMESFGYDQIFRNNTSYVSGRYAGDSGLICGKGGSRRCTAYNNIIYITGNADWGIVLGGETCIGCQVDGNAYECQDCVAYNNLIISRGGTANVGALGMAGCKQCSFYNNTVAGGGSGVALRTVTSATPNFTTDDPTFKNNILYNAGTATLFNYQGTLALDYNIFFGTPNAPAQTHPIIGDPRFVSPSSGDLHLQKGSPAIDAGVKLTQVSVDFDGVPRPRGAAYDIGACEYTGTTTLATPANLRVSFQ
jgi:hypothetical protein